MRTFKLVRDEDVSGISGTGVVAEGVVFHDGKALMEWFGEYPTVTEFPSIEAVIAIHSHGGKTRVVFDDEEGG